MTTTQPHPILIDSLKAIGGVAHGFFTRDGGVSTGIYASLNCGRGTKDDPDAVAENRARVAAALGATGRQLVCLHQCHSCRAITVTEPWSADAQPEADAFVTRARGIALGILTADCTPVLFAAPQAGVIAAAHAGWKGAFGGILEATINAMAALGAHPQDIIAAIGPTIRPSSYEVGADFAAARATDDPASAAFFAAGKRPGHAQFDLPGYVRLRLQKAGIGQVEDCGLDTSPVSQRFFSYRRTTLAQEPDYGRQISAILLV